MRTSKKLSFLVFWGDGDWCSRRSCLNTNSLFSHRHENDSGAYHGRWWFIQAMVIDGDVLLLKAILDLGLDGTVSLPTCWKPAHSSDTRASAPSILSTSQSTSLTNLSGGRKAKPVLLPATHLTIREVTVRPPKPNDCNNTRTTQGHNLFMYKIFAFCARKNRMKAWSCFLCTTACFVRLCYSKKRNLSFWHRRTEGNKTANAEKTTSQTMYYTAHVRVDLVLGCDFTHTPGGLWIGTDSAVAKKMSAELWHNAGRTGQTRSITSPDSGK